MAWEAPKVFVGQEVLFYPNAIRRLEDAQRATVGRIWDNNRGIQLRLSGGGVTRVSTQCVRHIDDPYFETHVEAGRSDGAWDLTPYTLYTEARIKSLEEKIESLEAIIDGLHSEA